MCFVTLLPQDPTEGVRAAERAAWPARTPFWRLMGVWRPHCPSRWGWSSSWGKTATTTQGPVGGPNAHPGGTQQAAGVSAPPPPTAIAPGDTTLRPICRTVLSQATGYGWEETVIDFHRLVHFQSSHLFRAVVDCFPTTAKGDDRNWPKQAIYRKNSCSTGA